MPKCDPDPVLLDQVNRFMKENRVTVNGAAAKLGVGRTTFWRFCESGKARRDTKVLYRNALEKHNIISATNVADDAINGYGLTNPRRAALAGGLAGDELKLIRRACEGVLVLLNVYEAQSLGSEN